MANSLLTQFAAAAAGPICSLFDRWQDEQEYEDIADYGKVVKTIADRLGCEFVKMTKSPFGATVKIEGQAYQFTATTTEYGYQPV